MSEEEEESSEEEGQGSEEEGEGTEEEGEEEGSMSGETEDYYATLDA